MKWSKIISRTISLTLICGVCFVLALSLNCFVSNNFQFRLDLSLATNKKTYQFFALFLSVAFLLWLMYCHKHYWLNNSNKIIKGNKKDNNIVANLEQARFQSAKEERKNFVISSYERLHKRNAGIPIRAEQNGKSYKITFAPNTHALIIGTTGSGKTTTFISPSIQILSQCKNKPSLIISDPKGELYMLHARSLTKRGYRVKVIDLRNPFNSIKWNPLEKPFLTYQRMLNLDDEVQTDDKNGSYIFESVTYANVDEVKMAVQLRKQQLFDEVYEELNDIITVLCPVTNKNEPIWESGAKNMVLAIALAMLEDSSIPELNMTIDKYNFYNLAKVATNTDNDCEELLNYFKNRNPISRSLSLSKQVLESAEKTRGSYLSTMFDKLNIFADLSLCSLTSANELTFDDFDECPTALFLQIPDERETRHSLASMLILQAYKELVKKANSYAELTLPRPVYFLLDEYGNLPPIHKMETMITVGRSRNIWLNLVVQSYAQLAKVYDEKVAEIIKSNCNIQVFIGTTDQKTIEDFSKRCGNYSVITRSAGFNTIRADDINTNASIKERPLIYPSELAQLNSSTNMGNAVVTVFGYQPIKSKFTPAFRVKKFKLGGSKEQFKKGKYFDEEKVFYDMKKRNRFMLMQKSNPKRRGTNMVSNKEIAINHEQIMSLAERYLVEVLSTDELKELTTLLENKRYAQSLLIIDMALRRSNELNLDHIIDSLANLRRKIQMATVQDQQSTQSRR